MVKTHRLTAQVHLNGLIKSVKLKTQGRAREWLFWYVQNGNNILKFKFKIAKY